MLLGFSTSRSPLPPKSPKSPPPRDSHGHPPPSTSHRIIWRPPLLLRRIRSQNTQQRKSWGGFTEESTAETCPPSRTSFQMIVFTRTSSSRLRSSAARYPIRSRSQNYFRWNWKDKIHVFCRQLWISSGNSSTPLAEISSLWLMIYRRRTLLPWESLGILVILRQNSCFLELNTMCSWIICFHQNGKESCFLSAKDAAFIGSKSTMATDRLSKSPMFGRQPSTSSVCWRND